MLLKSSSNAFLAQLLQSSPGGMFAQNDGETDGTDFDSFDATVGADAAGELDW